MKLRLILNILAIVAVLSIVASLNAPGIVGINSGILSLHSAGCEKGCCLLCAHNAILSPPGAAGLSKSACMQQCMNARCWHEAKPGQCDAFSMDGCCNVFATNDPDCEPVCQPGGVCVEDPSICCNGYVWDAQGCGSNRCLPVCKGIGVCVDLPSECCSGSVVGDPYGCPSSGISCA